MGRRRVSGKFADHSKYFLENLEIYSKAPTRSRKIIVVQVVMCQIIFPDLAGLILEGAGLDLSHLP